MARIDCLGPKKELAQLSSTLGREFALDLLEAVSAWDEKKLQDDLSQLVVAELFDYRGQSSQSYYSFRHALIHEVAYRSLLKSTRQKYHKRIAGILQHRFSDMVTENPELLAHHCTEAGQLELALFQWLRAGKAALQRSANIEAVTHFSNGLDVLSRVKESDELLWLPQTGGEAQDRQQYIAGIELAFQSSLGLALMMSKGYAAMEVEKAYSRARELCRDVSDIATVFPILCGLWGFYLVRAELGAAHDLAKQLVSLSSLAAKSRFEDEAKRAMGSTLFWCGRLSEARTLLGEVG